MPGGAAAAGAAPARPVPSPPPFASYTPPGGFPPLTPDQAAAFQVAFAQLDTDGDGYAQGMDCFPAFMQSGLHKGVLKEVWDLVAGDAGQLSAHQFVQVRRADSERAALDGSSLAGVTGVPRRRRRRSLPAWRSLSGPTHAWSCCLECRRVAERGGGGGPHPVTADAPCAVPVSHRVRQARHPGAQGAAPWAIPARRRHRQPAAHHGEPATTPLPDPQIPFQSIPVHT